ncbi:DNA-binding response regulator [Pedobacter yulinensis]|uniref:DNA-binding response regulator n=1 Tax=Pedobacter yulinensis TaxID=2126353 RepID=A0A2T3HRG3_9SPHI|nr:response regulator transcription factor [Pedobacter yulinensis]PST85006.1 DNA-binding response regulator [Pedobacter yulinensis]
MSSAITLIVADDHQMIIEGLLSVFAKESSMHIIGSVNNGKELLVLLDRVRPDVVLLDLNMPEMDGLTVLRTIRDAHPPVKTLIFSNYQNPELIAEVKALGANGYLIKNSPPSTLKAALMTVAQGQTFFEDEQREPDDASQVFFVDEFLKRYNLTKREVQIISMICSNMRSKEIADKLFLSELTVRTHRKNIVRKLGLQDSTVSLYEFAIRNHLINR